MKRICLILLICHCALPAFCQTIWAEDFENGIDAWTNIDGDGDGHVWEQVSSFTPASGSWCVLSRSYHFIDGPITPNNYLVSPEIDLTAESGKLLLDWKAFAQDQNWAEEHYQVYIADGNTQADVDLGVLVYDGIVGANGMYITETADISAFAGKKFHVAIVHNMVTDQFVLNIDDVEIYRDISSGINRPQYVAEKNLANLYPNPFDKVIHITVEVEAPTKLKLEIWNALGKRVYKKAIGKINGSHTLPIQTSFLTNGIYFFHIHLNEKVIIQKAILAR